jgi:hypothetical protein
MSTEAMTLALEEIKIGNYNSAAERLEAALAQPQQEPVDFVSLLREAEEIVQGKPTWNRFIAATPLANDIAVWMTVFAQDVARRDAPLPAQRKPLTDEEIRAIVRKVDEEEGHVIHFARAIEAKHNIKGDT